MPLSTVKEGWAAWRVRQQARAQARKARERVEVNLHPWTQPETPGEERARAALERFAPVEATVSILHHGLTGQPPLGVSRVADRTGRSFLEVVATLHAAEMRARNNAALRADLQAVLDEIAPHVRAFAQDLVDLRTGGRWSPRAEERLVKGWFFALKPIQRFALSALWDGPVPYACALIESELAAVARSPNREEARRGP